MAGQVLVLVSGSTDYPTVPDSWKHDEQQRIASMLNCEASEGGLYGSGRILDLMYCLGASFITFSCRCHWRIARFECPFFMSSCALLILIIIFSSSFILLYKHILPSILLKNA